MFLVGSEEVGVSVPCGIRGGRGECSLWRACSEIQCAVIMRSCQFCLLNLFGNVVRQIMTTFHCTVLLHPDLCKTKYTESPRCSVPIWSHYIYYSDLHAHADTHTHLAMVMVPILYCKNRQPP